MRSLQAADSRGRRSDELLVNSHFLVNSHGRSIFLVAPHGGIRPAEQRRSRLALTLAERDLNFPHISTHSTVAWLVTRMDRTYVALVQCGICCMVNFLTA
jgi:IS30 family transposase